MKKEDLKPFEGKRCLIMLTNGWRYMGLLIRVKDSAIRFDDRFDGEIVISTGAVNFVSLAEPAKEEQGGAKKTQ